MSRKALVVGVFGSGVDGTPDVAEDVGAEIARRGHVVLTGGNGRDTSYLVKDRAICGVRDAGGVWVGVDKEPRPPAHTRIGRSIQLHPGYGDRRNYIEACMSDVAIAFSGGAGTDAEVALCLARRRPLVLVGSSLPDRERLERAKVRLRPPGLPEPIDRQISDAFTELSRMFATSPPPLPACAILPLDTPVARIVACAELMVDTRRDGSYPTLPGDEDDPAEVYATWLAKL